MARPRGPDPRSVFLNVPYDAEYEPILLALLAALLALGRKPRATLEVEDRGEARPRRILEVLESTAVSFHDLSRAGASARFNMPFELGLAFSFAARTRRHRLYVLQAERGRLEETLSDLKGAEAVLAVLSRSSPDVANAHIDLPETYTNEFAAAAARIRPK